MRLPRVGPSGTTSAAGGLDMISLMRRVWEKPAPRAATASSYRPSLMASATAWVRLTASTSGMRATRLWRMPMMWSSASGAAERISCTAAMPRMVDIHRS